MELTWLVTIPPLIVLAVAISTHNVLYALLGGVLAAAGVASGGNLVEGAQLVLQKFLAESSILDIWNRSGSYDHGYTLGFLACLGIIIEFMTRSGGIIAYGTMVRSWIHTKRQAETISLVIAPLFFLDDYLNNLVGGSIVRPLFDQFSLARAKLAYLLNALSSSQCLLIPASSWLAFIVMQLQSSGITCNASSSPLVLADAYSIYLHTLPYLFYPILSILSAWFIVLYGISYGPMRTEETSSALEKKSSGQTIENSSATISSFFIPLLSFLVGIPVMMLMQSGWHPWHQTVNWCQAITNTDAIFAALWWASLSSVLISSLFFIGTKKASLASLATWIQSGIISMKSSIMLLTLAWMFASFLKHEVPAGAYIAHHIMGHAPLAIIPVICFVTATFITAIVGSSWGMISIMIPLALPMVTSLVTTPALPAALPLLLPVLGAILSGAAAGPHFSPITDAAIISSATADITPILHIRTALPYYLPGFIISAIGFFVITQLNLSLLQLIAFILGLAGVTFAALMVLNRRKTA